MTTKTKSRIKIALLAIGALLMIVLPLLLLTGCDNTDTRQRAESNQTSPTPTPSATPMQTVYMTEQAIETIVKKAREQFAEEWKKMHPEASPTPQPRLTPDPNIIANVSEDTRLREGIKLQSDADGTVLLRIHRKDNEPVTKGLTAETIAIEFYQQPIYTNMGDGKWEIVLKEHAAEDLKTEASATPSSIITPTPSATSNP